MTPTDSYHRPVGVLRQWGGSLRALTGGTLRVWWRLLPKILAIYATGWFGYQISLFAAAFVAPMQAFVALFMVSAGLIALLTATVVCLTVIGRELRLELISSEVRVGQPLFEQLAVTILPFLGIYAVFNTVQKAADRLVLNAIVLNGLGDDGLLAELNPLHGLNNGLVLLAVVIGAYIVRRGLDIAHDRTGFRVLGLGAAFIEGFFMLLVILSGSRLIAAASTWLSSRQFMAWFEVPARGLRGLGDMLHVDLPGIVLDGWTWMTSVGWPAVVKAVGEPVLWLAVAALIYGTGVLSLAELWRKGKPLRSTVPLSRSMARRNHLAEVRMSGSRGRVRRLGIEMSEAFFGDIDDKYLPTLQSLLLILKSGLAFLGSFIVVYAVVTFLANAISYALVQLIGGQTFEAWVGYDTVVEFIRVAITEPLRLCLLAVTFQLALKHFRGQASDDTVAAAPTMAVPS